MTNFSVEYIIEDQNSIIEQGVHDTGLTLNDAIECFYNDVRLETNVSEIELRNNIIVGICDSVGDWEETAILKLPENITKSSAERVLNAVKSH